MFCFFFFFFCMFVSFIIHNNAGTLCPKTCMLYSNYNYTKQLGAGQILGPETCTHTKGTNCSLRSDLYQCNEI
uniref:Putative secreted protein n=1 Tax=Rhipicephalus microplus TaxID=6941 RepID=A0A6M2DEA1_RHIMP